MRWRRAVVLLISHIKVKRLTYEEGIDGFSSRISIVSIGLLDKNIR
jgi:hypothetical protein